MAPTTDGNNGSLRAPSVHALVYGIPIDHVYVPGPNRLPLMLLVANFANTK